MGRAFYSTSETARLLNVNRVTVYRWIKEGKVKGHKIGRRFRVPTSEIQSLLKASGLPDSVLRNGDPEERRGPWSGRDDRRKLVLVIDRDRDVHRFIQASFTELGLDGTCRLKMFSCGIEAALEIGRDDPDLVLLDILMPDPGGLELARKIRAVHGRAKIVLMTRASLGPREDGVFESLVKPLNLKKLNRAVGDYLR